MSHAGQSGQSFSQQILVNASQQSLSSLVLTGTHIIKEQSCVIILLTWISHTFILFLMCETHSRRDRTRTPMSQSQSFKVIIVVTSSHSFMQQSLFCRPKQWWYQRACCRRATCPLSSLHLHFRWCRINRVSIHRSLWVVYLQKYHKTCHLAI